MNPLLHFEDYGWEEGRNPSSTFNTDAYESANPGLPAGEDPLVAYIDSLAVSIAPVTTIPKNIISGSGSNTAAANSHMLVISNSGTVVVADRISGSTTGADRTDVGSPSQNATSGGISEDIIGGVPTVAQVGEPAVGSAPEISTSDTVPLNRTTVASASDPLTATLGGVISPTPSSIQFIHAADSSGDDRITAGTSKPTPIGGHGTGTSVDYAGVYDTFQDTQAGSNFDTIWHVMSADQIDSKTLLPGGVTVAATASQTNSPMKVVTRATEPSLLTVGSFTQSGFTPTVVGTGQDHTHMMESP